MSPEELALLGLNDMGLPMAPVTPAPAAPAAPSAPVFGSLGTALPNKGLDLLARAIQFYGRPTNLVANLAQDAAGAATLPGDVATGKVQLPSRGGVPGSAPEEAGQTKMQPGSLFGWTLPDDARWESPGHGSPFGRLTDLTGFLIGGAPITAEKNAAGVFGGRLAQTADRSALARAEKMAADGVPPSDIWDSTGWFQGADKKWRFEIPDTDARFFPQKGDTRPKATLAEHQFDHPALYDAYPQLRSAGMGDLQHADPFGRDTGVRGAYMGGDRGEGATIGLSDRLHPVERRSVALHELQHGVQRLEDFARGGSPSSPAVQVIANSTVSERVANANATIDRLRAELQDHVNGQITAGKATERDWTRLAGQYWDNNPEKKASFDRAWDDMTREPQLRRSVADDTYRKLAGEVEARNVQTRADWPADKLRDVPPQFSQDVQFPQQIVTFGQTGPQQSSNWGSLNFVERMDAGKRIAQRERSRGAVTSPFGAKRIIPEAEPEAGSFGRLDAQTRAGWQNDKANILEDYRREVFPERYADPDGFTLGSGSTDKRASAIVNAATHLPMDDASRLARARELGFDTSRTVYHGSPDARGIDQGFMTSTERLLHKEDPDRAFFFADSPRVAKTYADDRRAFDYQNAEPAVVPAYLKMANPKVIDWEGKPWRGTAEAIAKAKAEGHDGLVINNVIDDYSSLESGKRAKPTTVRVVFNPEQIRKPQAAFDPANKDSGFLLGSGATDKRSSAITFGSLNLPMDEASRLARARDAGFTGAALPAPGGVRTPKVLYRGIVEGAQESGAKGLGTAHLGRGLYSSADRSFAKKYASKGEIVQLSPEQAWPSNPLVLNGAGGAGNLLLDFVFKNTNFRNAREFHKVYDDPADFLKALGYDGVVVNKGEEVVKFGSPPSDVTLGSGSTKPGSAASALTIANAARETPSFGSLAVERGLSMDQPARMARAAEQGYTLDAYHTTSAPEFDKFKRRPGDVGIHFGTPGQANDRLDYLRSREGWTPPKPDQDSPRMVPAKLNVQRPLRMNDAGAWNADNMNYQLETKFPNDVDRIRRLRTPAQIRDFIKSKGYDGIVYRNSGEVEGAHVLQQVADEAHKVLIESQRRRGKPLNSYDRADQATPEYEAYEQAYSNAKQFREENAADSYVAFEPDQIRSQFAAFDPKNKGKGFILGSGATDKNSAAITGGLNAAKTEAAPTFGSLNAPIRAYHGSPYDFDRFDLGKIGTGEGAQAYGHGLYFAENEGVARSYRDALSERGFKVTGADKPITASVLRDAGYSDIAQNEILSALRNHGTDYSSAIKEFNRRMPNVRPNSPQWNAILDASEMLKGLAGKGVTPASAGRMYEVNLNAPADRFLDHDAPIKNQPALVDLFGSLGYEKAGWPYGENRLIPKGGGTLLDLEGPGEGAVRALSTVAGRRGSSGSTYDYAGATDLLRDAGFRGIKYFDEGSRAVTSVPIMREHLAEARSALAEWKDNKLAHAPAQREMYQSQIDTLERDIAKAEKINPTRNFVVFDPEIIEIVRKYGLTGLLGAGALSDVLGNEAKAEP